MVNNKNKPINEQTETMNHLVGEAIDDVQKIDVLNLPPRKTVHDLQKKRVKIKLSQPFIRFFTVTLLVVAIIVLIIYLLWKEGFIFS